MSIKTVKNFKDDIFGKVDKWILFEFKWNFLFNIRIRMKTQWKKIWDFNDEQETTECVNCKYQISIEFQKLDRMRQQRA